MNSAQPPQPEPTDDLWKQGPVWTESERPVARFVARPLREFLRVEAAGSILLLLAAAAALVWANSPWSESYVDFWHLHVSLEIGSWHVEESLQHWVNDALMVIFFFVVGLEIKYELVHGDLRDPRTAALPIVAAVGGMVVPALIYVAIAGGGDTGSGWGIPMATDIAFAVGVLGLLGRRLPSAARLFLLTLAIVDDIGAILVIALFYTADLDLGWLAAALVLLGLVAALRLVRVWALPVYLVLGVAAWYALFESGVHATLAGVALGLLTPATPLLEERVAREYAQEALRDRHLDPDELTRLRFLLGGVGVDGGAAAEPAAPGVGVRRPPGVRARQRRRRPGRRRAGRGGDLRGRSRHRGRARGRQAARHHARLLPRRAPRHRPAARAHLVAAGRRARRRGRHRVHGLAVHRAAVVPRRSRPHRRRQGRHPPGVAGRRGGRRRGAAADVAAAGGRRRFIKGCRRVRTSPRWVRRGRRRLTDSDEPAPPGAPAPGRTS
ncbi:Na+/H+ antiporter NhaA [Nocardioides sp. TF02-7]|uniref:Na+/H+ antiporter NhaA n=1 Tax=Nocardioides sp. TF02-7 TaxID=2917724 RepID=UPI001F051DC0|nr:Na+/H+ antiporter NhaA [Nocardioides sp. TF02-7]UMG94738.1 Na+/H+ antiporter NhaA [Nocardioides sp. TF02-7]